MYCGGSLKISHNFTPDFSQINYKPQTMAESLNRFIALDKPLKSTSVNSTTMNKNPSWKSFKEGKYAREHYRRQRVLPSKEMLGCSEQTTDKKARQGGKFKRSWTVDWWRGILVPIAHFSSFSRRGLATRIEGPIVHAKSPPAKVRQLS